MNMSFDLHPAPRVLHVDPDEDSAVVLATLLAPETQVVHAATYEQAHSLLQQGEFALLVIDPDLPDGDGHTLIRTLRQLDQHTPVLLYSASQPSLHHQAHAFLPKPWTSPRQLWRTVSHMLGLDVMVPART
ncbi:response regulator [Pseudoduganella sp. DS3]|uniref:Response regulator n=1 Tax=Pseudoduganella guangdongensis TaxID=2692179 RepID=A0A6N9HJP0_9BURK|nr:response regulator [Pseudoduganella guangdongensis]MYN03559.1 response regulator [Pseudoduganella guangdongensis]